MTAEDRCGVCKELFSNSEEVVYMEERIYAVKVLDMVTLVKADNPKEALMKAKRTINMTMNGFVGAIDIAIQSLEAWGEVLKDVQDWQDDFNAHVECLRLTDAEKEATMMYGEDVINIIGNHMVELKEVEE